MSARIVDGAASATVSLQRLHALSLSRPTELKLRLTFHHLFNLQP